MKFWRIYQVHIRRGYISHFKESNRSWTRWDWYVFIVCQEICIFIYFSNFVKDYFFLMLLFLKLFFYVSLCLDFVFFENIISVITNNCVCCCWEWQHLKYCLCKFFCLWMCSLIVGVGWLAQDLGMLPKDLGRHHYYCCCCYYYHYYKELCWTSLCFSVAVIF